MIKHAANPFFIAFTLPFLFMTALVFMQFQVPTIEFELIHKPVSIPSGDERLTVIAESFYTLLGKMPSGDILQNMWLVQYAEGKTFIRPLFAAWIAVHAGVLIGAVFCGKRWVVMYFTRQYEKQSLLSDRKLMK